MTPTDSKTKSQPTDLEKSMAKTIQNLIGSFRKDYAKMQAENPTPAPEPIPQQQALPPLAVGANPQMLGSIPAWTQADLSGNFQQYLANATAIQQMPLEQTMAIQKLIMDRNSNNLNLAQNRSAMAWDQSTQALRNRAAVLSAAVQESMAPVDLKAAALRTIGQELQNTGQGVQNETGQLRLENLPRELQDTNRMNQLQIKQAEAGEPYWSAMAKYNATIKGAEAANAWESAELDLGYKRAIIGSMKARSTGGSGSGGSSVDPFSNSAVSTMIEGLASVPNTSGSGGTVVDKVKEGQLTQEYNEYFYKALRYPIKTSDGTVITMPEDEARAQAYTMFKATHDRGVKPISVQEGDKILSTRGNLLGPWNWHKAPSFAKVLQDKDFALGIRENREAISFWSPDQFEGVFEKWIREGKVTDFKILPVVDHVTGERVNRPFILDWDSKAVGVDVNLPENVDAASVFARMERIFKRTQLTGFKKDMNKMLSERNLIPQ